MNVQQKSSLSWNTTRLLFHKLRLGLLLLLLNIGHVFLDEVFSHGFPFHSIGSGITQVFTGTGTKDSTLFQLFGKGDNVKIKKALFCLGRKENIKYLCE